MLDFDDHKVIEFKFKGEVHQLEYPSYNVSKKFKDLYQKVDKDELELLIEYIEACGGKREILEQLRLPQLNKLAMELAGENMEVKKN